MCSCGSDLIFEYFHFNNNPPFLIINGSYNDDKLNLYSVPLTITINEIRYFLFSTHKLILIVFLNLNIAIFLLSYQLLGATNYSANNHFTVIVSYRDFFLGFENFRPSIYLDLKQNENYSFLHLTLPYTLLRIQTRTEFNK